MVAALLGACGKQEAVDIPSNSALLAVAQCPNTTHDDFAEYATELKGAGELRLSVDPELTKPFGAVNRATVYGRAYSDSVWEVLVHDFADVICQGYVAHDVVTVVGVLDPETL